MFVVSSSIPVSACPNCKLPNRYSTDTRQLIRIKAKIKSVTRPYSARYSYAKIRAKEQDSVFI